MREICAYKSAASSGAGGDAETDRRWRPTARPRLGLAVCPEVPSLISTRNSLSSRIARKCNKTNDRPLIYPKLHLGAYRPRIVRLCFALRATGHGAIIQIREISEGRFRAQDFCRAKARRRARPCRTRREIQAHSHRLRFQRPHRQRKENGRQACRRRRPTRLHLLAPERSRGPEALSLAGEQYESSGSTAARIPENQWWPLRFDRR